MKKLKIIYVPLFIGVLLVGFFGECKPVVAEELPPTSSKLAPETEQEASDFYGIPVERLSRDTQGGNGWYMSLDETAPEDIYLRRYFKATTPLGTFDPTETVEGTELTPPVVVATMWLRDDLIPYPETNYAIEYFPSMPVENETMYFSIVTNGQVASVIAEIEWHFGDTVQRYSVEDGMEVTTKFQNMGLYDVYVYLKNEWDEVVYEIYPIQVAVAEKTEEFTIFLPSVMKNYSAPEYVPFLTEALDYCPVKNPHEVFGGRIHEGGVVGALEDWIIGPTCSFTPAFPGELYMVTIQLGSEFHTLEYGILLDPEYKDLIKDFTIWVPNWWGS